MKLIISKIIGRRSYNFEFEGSNFHEVVMESQKLSFPDVLKCGVCGNEHLVLGARVAESGGKKFKYTYIKCLNRDCKAELTFGQKVEGEVFYLRKNEHKQPDWRTMEGTAQPSGATEDKKEEDDLPF